MFIHEVDMVEILGCGLHHGVQFRPWGVVIYVFLCYFYSFWSCLFVI